MMLNIGFGALVAQHFLLSAAARTLSLSSVARMSDDEALGLMARTLDESSRKTSR